MDTLIDTSRGRKRNSCASDTCRKCKILPMLYMMSQRECIIIDPSWDLEKIMDVIKNKSSNPSI